MPSQHPRHHAYNDAKASHHLLLFNAVMAFLGTISLAFESCFYSQVVCQGLSNATLPVCNFANVVAKITPAVTNGRMGYECGAESAPPQTLLSWSAFNATHGMETPCVGQYITGIDVGAVYQCGGTQSAVLMAFETGRNSSEFAQCQTHCLDPSKDFQRKISHAYRSGSVSAYLFVWGVLNLVIYFKKKPLKACSTLFRKCTHTEITPLLNNPPPATKKIIST